MESNPSQAATQPIALAQGKWSEGYPVVLVDGPTHGSIVDISPGDATRYHFIVVTGLSGYGWDSERGEIAAVSSVDGPIMPGITIPIEEVQRWWNWAKDLEPYPNGARLDDPFLGYVLEHAGRGQVNVNPWTVVAAFMAVLQAAEGRTP